MRVVLNYSLPQPYLFVVELVWKGGTARQEYRMMCGTAEGAPV